MVHPAAGTFLPGEALSMAIDRVGPAAGMPAVSESATPAAGQHDGGFANLLPAATGRIAPAEPRPGGVSGASMPPASAYSSAAPPASTSGVAWLQAGIAKALAREAQDKQARRHGRAMLQALGAVQLAVLGGDDGQARSALASLASTVEDEHPADDPVLRLILREIGVRAAVELARADQTGDVSIG